MKVSSAEFEQNVDRYQDAAQHAPVLVTKNARTHTVLVSASLFETLLKGRVARPVEQLDADTLSAISNARVPDEFAELNGLLDDWKP